MVVASQLLSHWPSASDGVAVVLMGRMHPVIVKLPPLLCALSGPLILLWKIRSILVVE